MDIFKDAKSLKKNHNYAHGLLLMIKNLIK